MNLSQNGRLLKRYFKINENVIITNVRNHSNDDEIYLVLIIPIRGIIRITMKTEVTSTPTRPVDNVVITTKGLQNRNIHIIDGTKVENKGKST